MEGKRDGGRERRGVQREEGREGEVTRREREKLRGERERREEKRFF